VNIFEPQLNVNGHINLNDHPTVKEYFELYQKIKLARQKTEATKKLEEKMSLRQRKLRDIEHSKLQSKLNKLANMISGIQILDALEDNTELCIKDMQWEYYSKDAKKFKFEYLFDDLVLHAGSLDSIPKFVLGELKLLGSTEFYKKYSFLMGTTLSLRLENNTKEGLYFCIPFRSLKLGYLTLYLKQCTIVIPEFDHNMQRSSDQYSYEELEALTAKYYRKARYIVEQCDLPAYIQS
jgi:hypothetical protein